MTVLTLAVIITAMPSYVSLVITSTAFGLKSEKKYPLDLTLGKFKEKLVLMTGCEPSTMKLELLDDSERHVAFLADDFKTLEELGVKDDTVLAWKKRNKIGKFKELDPEEAKKAEEKRLAAEAKEKALIEKMKIGDRCGLYVRFFRQFREPITTQISAYLSL
ncbi:unnamed protein product [Dibothriocephalus latus]|uniref:Ubiquitin-like domain-containing protein n=1 Tax=Dibothriocephalus latus TaxID=60516 RepID=A0A3P7LA72_DIBLA|nr:unnamed protein product [Dibothriocephalus latus]